MGRSKKKTMTKKQKAKQDAYVQAIIIMIFSMVLTILIYGQTGTFGKALSEILGGLVGWIKYIVPIGALVVGVLLTKEQKKFIMPKMIQYLVVILCVSGLMSMIQISNKHLNMNQDFTEIISEAYNSGVQNKGGRSSWCINRNSYV